MSAETVQTYNNSWKTIYELIDENYFHESKFFIGESLQMCKTKPNEPQNILNESKRKIKRTDFGVFNTSYVDMGQT